RISGFQARGMYPFLRTLLLHQSADSSTPNASIWLNYEPLSAGRPRIRTATRLTTRPPSRTRSGLLATPSISPLLRRREELAISVAAMLRLAWSCFQQGIRLQRSGGDKSSTDEIGYE